MNELAQSRALLEIHYENEVGTGLGPTLEFYTLVSKELQRADLALWKGDAVKISSSDVVMEENESGGGGGGTSDPCIEYVHSSAGLYPVPLARNAKSSHRNKVFHIIVFLRYRVQYFKVIPNLTQFLFSFSGESEIPVYRQVYRESGSRQSND